MAKEEEKKKEKGANAFIDWASRTAPGA